MDSCKGLLLSILKLMESHPYWIRGQRGAGRHAVYWRNGTVRQ
jgi:hypothetical protein